MNLQKKLLLQNIFSKYPFSLRVLFITQTFNLKRFYMKMIMIVIFCLLRLNVNAQEQELKTYLTALKTGEFEESKKILNELSFPGCNLYVISGFDNISGITFDTDSKGVKGYKAIFNCKVQNKLGGFIDKRMMVISYFDKQSKKWRILDIREPLTACDEYELAKSNIDVTRSQHSWTSVSYWALMCGKILKAKEAVATSESRARAVNDKNFSNPYAQIINKIL